MSAHSPVDRRKPIDVDSTQRMRALTPSELYDSHRPRWYAIQLVVSDRAVNLDMMPRLEVFAAHRLYTIAAKQQTGIWHALRLGFFPDEASAQVICGYLQTFFSSPTIVRVSTAEQERFAPTVPPRAPASTPASASALSRQANAQRPIAGSEPAVKQPAPTTSGPRSSAGRSKTLAEELLEEAREVQRSRSGRNRTPEQSGSWLMRLFGGPKPRARST
jgi:hypothetical protein